MSIESRGISAKMICDSISEQGIRLTTLQVSLPKFLLSQLNTHRMFSRNAASSRAIPTSKIIERVENDPVIPIFWGKNKPGMQATEEIDQKGQAQLEWRLHAGEAISSARELVELKVHKQIANRLLEPFMYVDVLITATEWDNFFDLRLHDSTQPEMREVARVMKEAMDSSVPVILHPGEWHAPYTREIPLKPDHMMIKCSVARCARVSYLNHDQSNPDLSSENLSSTDSKPMASRFKKDLELYDRLFRDKHLSPFEHQATPMRDSITTQHHAVVNWEPGITHMDKDFNLWSGNLRGWAQYRQMI